MKRIGLFLLTFLMALGAVGCSPKENNSSSESSKASSQASSSASGMTAGGVKFGMTVQADIASSKEATADRDGTAQVDAVLAAVVLDAEGKILQCRIDEVQNKMSFSASGALKTSKETAFATKREVGNNYGMKAASSIGKEWFEQVDALEAYLKGKTADQVAEVPTDEDGYATDDLKASCTISLSKILPTVEKACREAQDSTASAEDELKISAVSKMAEQSKDAESGAEGICRADSAFCALLTKNGKITDCRVDELQATVKITDKGMISSDTEEAVQTKKQLGDAYGVKGASSIGKEWYSQAQALEAFVARTGAAPQTDADGYAADADLKAGCTIGVAGMKEGIEKTLGE